MKWDKNEIIELESDYGVLPIELLEEKYKRLLPFYLKKTILLRKTYGTYNLPSWHKTEF